jgi:hypothetical protein
VSRPLRSAWALFAGFLAVVILSLGTDAILHATGVFPPWNGPPPGDALLALATAYRTVFSIAGSYLTARLAPDRPMQHALLGGAIGLVIALIGVVATWNRVAEFGPHWYPVSLVVLAMPGAWAGGKLLLTQVRH